MEQSIDSTGLDLQFMIVLIHKNLFDHLKDQCSITALILSTFGFDQEVCFYREFFVLINWLSIVWIDDDRHGQQEAFTPRSDCVDQLSFVSIDHERYVRWVFLWPRVDFVDCVDWTTNHMIDRCSPDQELIAFIKFGQSALSPKNTRQSYWLLLILTMDSHLIDTLNSCF